MKITWLGQLSLLIETEQCCIMVDPYLTDNLRENVGKQFTRMLPVKEDYLTKQPDMILLSHVHGDHTDIPSLTSLMNSGKRVEVLAGAKAWGKVRETIGGKHNYIQMTPGTEWTFRDVHVKAVPAFHSDETAIGFLIHAEGRTIYITGDTLYSQAIAEAVNEPVHIMFAVMNGLGNNMNYIDAVRLAKAVGAQCCAPMHWGMFEAFSADPSQFKSEADTQGVAAWIPTPYKEVKIS